MLKRATAARSSGRARRWFLGLLGLHAIGYANWWWGPFRLTSSLANYLVMAIVFLVPLALIIITTRTASGTRRAALFVILLPWAAWCEVLLIGAAQNMVGIVKNGQDPTFVYLHSTVTSQSRVAVYRTDYFATTTWGITVRHELPLAPGLLVVRTLGGFYPCFDADVDLMTENSVRIACTTQASHEGFSQVFEDASTIELKHRVAF